MSTLPYTLVLFGHARDAEVRFSSVLEAFVENQNQNRYTYERTEPEPEQNR